MCGGIEDHKKNAQVGYLIFNRQASCQWCRSTEPLDPYFTGIDLLNYEHLIQCRSYVFNLWTPVCNNRSSKHPMDMLFIVGKGREPGFCFSMLVEVTIDTKFN
ncbi:hypothetical protein O6H91_10G041000 [Diphasiastrum complanatum]|uniref:Uncharacterized protein n=1 Tax=Diphasiastrum complanatum TaxID=34168 RepID=A0ACC2CGB2_DIPCM|nr:hypothetical protein O6H91_10G041000 [Diphasiastrum complanatum]